MRGHEIDQILEPIFSECSLFRILGPDSFERNVDKCHQQQIKQEPIHTYGHAVELAAVHLYARTAPSCRSNGEQHSGQRQSLFLAQERRERSKCNRRHDEELDQKSREVKRIERPKFGGGQELGKMEAQDSSEREKSKKDGQHSTPPTCAKSGRIGVAKEFVNFLFDQGGS